MIGIDVCKKKHLNIKAKVIWQLLNRMRFCCISCRPLVLHQSDLALYEQFSDKTE